MVNTKMKLTSFLSFVMLNLYKTDTKIDNYDVNFII